MSDLPIISTFWHGDTVPLWSRACLSSFVRHGHEVRVYSFNAGLPVPPGVALHDASEILPESEVFVYRRGRFTGSVSAFSNLFRYKLLLERGGYWVDADVLCLRPFPAFDRATVGREETSKINGAVIYAAPGDPFLEACYEESRRLGRDVQWGQPGPLLVTRMAMSGGFDVNILPAEAFYPVHWKQVVPKLLFPENKAKVLAQTANSLGLHLYNEVLSRTGISTSCLPPENSYLADFIDEASGPAERTLSVGEIRIRLAQYYARRVPGKSRELLASLLRG